MTNKESNLDKWLKKNVSQVTDLKNTKPEKKSTFRRFFNKNQNTNSNGVKLIFLGGLNEVGKNMMAIEYKQDIVIIDMGLLFPSEDMLGVDYIVSDTTYLEKNKDKIRGVLITHGHLDHIGGISYMAPKLDNPKFYSLKLTNGLISKQLKEKKLQNHVKVIDVKPREKFKLGVFEITFFRVNHSIPDSCGIAINTPDGLIVHTGDFKFDETPADGIQADYDFIKKLGEQGVAVLMSDSTNSTKPGKAISEKVVGDSLEDIINNTKGRLIIACFSSLIGRMQQIIDAAKKNNRKIFVSGRSMTNNIEIAYKLGYLKYPKGMIQKLKSAGNESHKDNALILTTGSQGESLSALTRMAFNDHPHLKIIKSDTVVFSSSPIVGNERAVTSVLNEIVKTGAKVITNSNMDVHTTGHGYIEDLKSMLNYIKPKHFIPVHGEFYHRAAHKDLAKEIGLNENNIHLLENGEIAELKDQKLYKSKQTVPSEYILVDNQTHKLSTIANHIVSERQAMSLNGVIVINVVLKKKDMKPQRIYTQSHGFIYMHETKKLLGIINKEAENVFKSGIKSKGKNPETYEIEKAVKQHIDKIITKKIQRRPLIVPLVTLI